MRTRFLALRHKYRGEAHGFRCFIAVAIYKDYKFTKIRSEPVYFKGEIFAMRLSALVFWALFSTRFFAVFKYGAHVGIPCALFCHIKNSKERKFD